MFFPVSQVRYGFAGLVLPFVKVPCHTGAHHAGRTVFFKPRVFNKACVMAVCEAPVSVQDGRVDLDDVSLQCWVADFREWLRDFQEGQQAANQPLLVDQMVLGLALVVVSGK